MGVKDFGRIAVLAGGPSNEREISLRSGKAVYKALTNRGCDVIFLDVGENFCDIIKRNNVDVAFIALHGRFGEDGTIQKILEDRGIPYTGSGPEASKLALDKVESKKIFLKNGIPVPRYEVIEKGLAVPDSMWSFGMPLVIKPQFEGSSIGLSVVRNKEAVKKAAEEAFKYGPKIIVEEFITGRELTVGIFHDNPLPVIEIVAKNKVYDYAAKYADPDTKYLVPAPIDEKFEKEARELGKRAHKALGCRFLSRVDMMLSDSGKMFVLEVNTIPGMTERSLLPKAAMAAGMSFEDLCIKIIENTLSGKHETAKKK